MTPENAALGIGAFLIVVVMARIWRRVRLMEARLSETQEEGVPCLIRPPIYDGDECEPQGGGSTLGRTEKCGSQIQ